MDALIGLLAQYLNSSVFVLIVILIAVFFLLFKAGGYIERLKNQEKRICGVEDQSNTIPTLQNKLEIITGLHDNRLAKMEEISTNVTNLLNKIDIKTDAHDKRLCKTEDVADSIIALQTKVDLIYQNTLKNPTVVSHSPITLTELGKNIIKNVKGNTLFEKYSQTLIAEVESANPTNAYDIQQQSMLVVKHKMENMLNADELVALKNEAFKNGILLEDVINIFGVLLRDKILEEKHIPIADVDKHKK